MLGYRTFILAAVALCGCGGAPIDVDAVASRASRAILDGEPAPEDTDVVGIVRITADGFDICSGSLITPNLVLTAHHCVADVLNGENEQVSCTSSAFAAPDTPDNFLVTTAEVLPTDASAYHTVIGVLVPPQSTNTGFCGVDVALLELGEPLPPDEATPLVPRVDVGIHAGEPYSAVGYGATSPDGSNAGTRRQVGGLAVACLDASCGGPTGIAVGREWLGGGGPCQGDSGGPALDDQQRVMGVVSRANDRCSGSVYGAVFSWSSWLKQQARSAADDGGIAAPAWVNGVPTSTAASGGCNGASGAPLVAALACLLLWRRRCYSAAPRWAARRSRSPNTPPAVTSGPAPGPCTRSGCGS